MANTQFKLSKVLHSKLPEHERKNAEKKLLDKSNGLCALCNNPLGDETDLIVADHRVPESKNGKTTISNLYLAHKSCNSSRKNLDFHIAQPIVEFKVFCDDKSAVTFADVLKRYVENASKEIKYIKYNDTAELVFTKSHKVNCPVFRDPATNIEYLFSDIPVQNICDDPDIQPRYISYAHVRRLALDFLERPVHEPSNCRLVMKSKSTALLKQFDGQHKTTAQILLGRKYIQVKIYIDPDIALLQKLVIKIQQEIKKQPLTRSDTLAKLGDVMKNVFAMYSVPEGQIRTEKGLIENQPKDKRVYIKKLYLDELIRLIFWDDDNDLTKWVKPGVKHPPTTDKQVIDKIIAKMVFPNLLEDIDLDKEGGRDNERKLILVVLNTITKKMLPKNWYTDTNKLQRKRTETFFLGGAIVFWMNEILIPAIRYFLQRIGDNNKKPMFIEPVAAYQESKIIEAVETLCDWDIWSTDEVDILKAFRSNTLKNVLDVLPSINQMTLIKEIQNT